jgi:hypothetical protein
VALSSRSTFAYYITLTNAYRTGDLSFSYPDHARRGAAHHRDPRHRVPRELPALHVGAASCSSRRHRQHRVRAARAPPLA